MPVPRRDIRTWYKAKGSHSSPPPLFISSPPPLLCKYLEERGNSVGSEIQRSKRETLSHHSPPSMLTLILASSPLSSHFLYLLPHYAITSSSHTRKRTQEIQQKYIPQYHAPQTHLRGFPQALLIALFTLLHKRGEKKKRHTTLRISVAVEKKGKNKKRKQKHAKKQLASREMVLVIWIR